MENYQVRLVKRIDNDGTIITDPNLGELYPHEQKTLKSYHTLEDATRRARDFNKILPPGVKGMVIVQFKPGKATTASGSIMGPHIKGEPRKKGSTVWLSFIDRAGNVKKIDGISHKLISERHLMGCPRF